MATVDGAQEVTTIGGFVGRLIADGRAQLVEHGTRVRADPADADAVHRARVASRRLRSNLTTFGSLLDRTTTDPLREDLGWIGRSLGEVRDAQVLALRLASVVDEHHLAPDGLAPIEDVVAGQLESGIVGLSNALVSDRYEALAARLRDAAERPPIRRNLAPTTVADDLVRRVLKHRWKSVRRSIDRLGDQPSDEVLHDHRKRLRRVRYGIQAARPLGVSPKGFAKRLGRVQDDLGDLHDAVELRRWVDEHRDQFGSPAAAFLAGQLEQVALADEEQLREAWRATWEAVRPFRVLRPD